jgi:hypothetical protein
LKSSQTRGWVGNDCGRVCFWLAGLSYSRFVAGERAKKCGFAGVGSSVWCTTAGLVCAMDMFTQGLAHFANARRWLTEREQRGKQSPLSAPSLLRPAAPCQPVFSVPDVRNGVLGSCRRAVAAVWAREFFLFWVARTQTTSDHDQTHTVCFSLGCSLWLAWRVIESY